MRRKQTTDAPFLETVAPSASGVEDADERITSRADALRGCAIVYTMQIGGPASAKLMVRRIHPMKTKTEADCDRLSQVEK
jgi:nitrogen fixation protein NifX